MYVKRTPYECPKCGIGEIIVVLREQGFYRNEQINSCTSCGYRIHSADLPLLIQNRFVGDIVELESERLAWSTETFLEATAYSSLQKLKTEIEEVEQDITAGLVRPEEYADMLMCLFDSAGRQGVFPNDIFLAFQKKLKVNKARKWVKNPDNTYSHIK